MRIRLSLLAIATAAALALAGCGNGGTTQTATDDAGATSPGRPTADASVSASASARSSETSAETPADAAGPVPESLRFQATTLDGKPFDGAGLAGKPAVLWFWAAWCPKCRRAAPSYKQAAETFGDRVRLIGVAGKSDQPAMRDFVSDYNLEGITHLAGDSDPLWSRFRITYQDQYVVIDRTGKIVHTGELSEQELTDRLTELAG